MKVTLYAIPGSHPVMCARLMLEQKRIPYRRIDLPPVLSRTIVKRVLRFPGDRVPAMRIDGRRVQGSRAIARELDRLRSEPALLPGDPEQRAKIEEAERWGDVEFQELPRKITWWALKRRKRDQESFLADARLGVPTSILVATSEPIIRLALRLNDATDEVVRDALAAIPSALDRVDGLIADGVIGGERPNAADFQLATTVRLLMSFDDIEPAIDGRPAGDHARRVLPEAPGRIGPVFPGDWLAPLRRGAETAKR